MATNGHAPLEGKTALVTGGTTGIGFATAERLLADGVQTLIITGQDTARLREAAGRLGERAIPIRADVRSLAELDRLATAARQAVDSGRLDILFANAGVGSFAPIEKVDESFYDNQFQVNVKGLFFTVQKLLPLMGDGGSIILNASAVNAKGLAGGHVYFATKAAVRSLARTLAAELAPRGIRVNRWTFSPRRLRAKRRLGGSASPRRSPRRSPSSPAAAPPTSPPPTSRSTAAG